MHIPDDDGSCRFNAESSRVNMADRLHGTQPMSSDCSQALFVVSWYVSNQQLHVLETRSVLYSTLLYSRKLLTEIFITNKLAFPHFPIP